VEGAEDTVTVMEGVNKGALLGGMTEVMAGVNKVALPGDTAKEGVEEEDTNSTGKVP
jgi:hypothetical protein